MENNRRNERNRNFRRDDRYHNSERDQYRNTRNEPMHQRNWSQHGEHGENYGLGDTSQGSGNYGHPPYEGGRGSSGREHYGGYSGWNRDDERNYDYGNRSQGYNPGHEGEGRYGSSNQRYNPSNRYNSGRSNYEWGQRSSDDWNSGSYGRNQDYRNWDDDRDWWDRTSDEVASWFGDEDAQRRREMDKTYGGHRGKGPKGYARSDEKIKDAVEESLYHDDHVDASDIEVEVENGEVTLKGTVQDRYSKRRAEYTAESVTGVSDVSNHLKVKKEDRTISDFGSTATTGMASSNTRAGEIKSEISGVKDSRDQSGDLVRKQNK